MVSRMAIKTNADVASKIRGLAAERRISRIAMAETLNVSEMSISRRMNGTTPFSAEELSRLSNLMDTPVGAFFGEPTGARGSDAA